MPKALLIKFFSWLRFVELTFLLESLRATWTTEKRLVNENITVYAEQTDTFRTNDTFTLLQEYFISLDCLWFIAAKAC